MNWSTQRSLPSAAGKVIDKNWQVHWTTIGQKAFSAVHRCSHGNVLEAGGELGGSLVVCVDYDTSIIKHQYPKLW